MQTQPGGGGDLTRDLAPARINNSNFDCGLNSAITVKYVSGRLLILQCSDHDFLGVVVLCMGYLLQVKALLVYKIVGRGS